MSPPHRFVNAFIPLKLGCSGAMVFVNLPQCPAERAAELAPALGKGSACPATEGHVGVTAKRGVDELVEGDQQVQ
jgi:hypothetical protein